MMLQATNPPETADAAAVEAPPPEAADHNESPADQPPPSTLKSVTTIQEPLNNKHHRLNPPTSRTPTEDQTTHDEPQEKAATRMPGSCKEKRQPKIRHHPLKVHPPSARHPHPHRHEMARALGWVTLTSAPAKSTADVTVQTRKRVVEANTAATRPKRQRALDAVAAVAAKLPQRSH